MPEYEQYIESIIIRDDNRSDVNIPMFEDTDVDAEFEFEGTIKLVQILKSVQNARRNRHTYVFKLTEIKKIQKEI